MPDTLLPDVVGITGARAGALAGTTVAAVEREGVVVGVVG
jgi:hypothetical protein